MTLSDLLPEDRKEAEILLGIMSANQTRLWDASLELENILGMDIDTNWDMEGMTLEDLVDRASEEGYELGQNFED